MLWLGSLDTIDRMTLVSLGIHLLFQASLASGIEPPCAADDKNFIEVVAERSELYLCEGRQASKSFKVSLGSGGLDKKVQGDQKTPLGTYSLGVPRDSNRFFTFIPVGYPTGDQRARGFTGGDVGIHGPARNLTWLGRANTWIDWTDGCIAVAYESEISEIAAWIKEKKVGTIVVR
ncbi:MAG: L,D-transpeptidase family protein [Bdellovibrionota bacterium]